MVCERGTTSHTRHITFPVPAHTLTKDSHNTGNFMPYSIGNMEGVYETGPTVYRLYPRRLEILTIC